MAAITPYGRRSMQVVALNAGETVGEWGTCNLSQHTEQRMHPPRHAAFRSCPRRDSKGNVRLISY